MASWEFDNFKFFYPKIKNILSMLYLGLKKEFPDAFANNIQEKQKLAIFGVDFMVDSKENIIILEANHGPCFPTADEHPLQQNLYKNFWQDFINDFLIKTANYKFQKLE